MNKDLQNVVSTLSNLAEKKTKLLQWECALEREAEALKESFKKERTQQILQQHEITMEHKALQKKYSDAMLDINTQLSYRTLRKILGLSGGPLI